MKVRSIQRQILCKQKKRADSFGLSTFLVRKGYVSDIRTAKRLSNLLMVIFIIAALLFIIIFNAAGSKNSVDEKYYYDPTVTD